MRLDVFGIDQTVCRPWKAAVRLLLAAAVAGLGIAGCGKGPAPLDYPQPVGEAVEIAVPLGLPPVPASPRVTAGSIMLGRRLFYDARLSGDETISCAGCHSPGRYFSDGLVRAIGIKSRAGARNTPTALNAVYNSLQFWDGRAASLEQQALGPIANRLEMDLPHDVLVEKLRKDPNYEAEFARVFGPGGITIGRVVSAIASFERTLLSGNSPFDRYRYGGDKDALSPEAIRGLAVFTDRERGNCVTCHTIEDKFALLTDGKFHNVGAGMNAEGELTDLGRFEQTRKETDRGAFRTPSLRNVAKTAPYMHDGKLQTLREVIDFYVGGGNSNPQLDKEIKPLRLSARDRGDLEAFLESLTGELPPNSGPIGKDKK